MAYIATNTEVSILDILTSEYKICSIEFNRTSKRDMTKVSSIDKKRVMSVLSQINKLWSYAHSRIICPGVQ